MEQKTCKKCGRPLPDKYKYKRCEYCRNEGVKKLKDIGNATGKIAITIGMLAISITTNQKFNLTKKK